MEKDEDLKKRFGNAENLAFTASVISMFALSLEHYIEGRTGNDLFGAVTSR